jgi:hypothetical protein
VKRPTAATVGGCASGTQAAAGSAERLSVARS